MSVRFKDRLDLAMGLCTSSSTKPEHGHHGSSRCGTNVFRQGRNNVWWKSPYRLTGWIFVSSPALSGPCAPRHHRRKCNQDHLELNQDLNGTPRSSHNALGRTAGRKNGNRLTNSLLLGRGYCSRAYCWSCIQCHLNHSNIKL